MARNGSGTFNLPTSPAVSGTTATAAFINTNLTDIANGLTQSLSKDGQTTPTANLPMGGFRLTGLGNATARTDAAPVGQVQNDAYNWAGTAGGTADALTLTPSPAITAYAAGQRFRFIAAADNTGTATVAVSGLTATAIQQNGSALSSGQIATGKLYEVIYDGTQFQLTRIGTLGLLTSDIGVTVQAHSGDLDDIAALTPNNGDVLTYSGGAWTASAPSSSGLPRSYLSGLGLSNNSTDADHDIDVAAGVCRDAANAADISLSAITKRIDATWAAGTGNGGLATSLSAPANNTWYHVFAIIVGGSADVGFDTSITAANLATDNSATAYRRIGSVLTDGSANILAFSQYGDEFWWSDPPLDVNNGSSGTSANTATLSVPTGLSLIARVNFTCPGGATAYLSPLFVNDEAPSTSAAPLGQWGNNANINLGWGLIQTNTSAQIRYRMNNGGQVYGTTLGWVDTRGRDA